MIRSKCRARFLNGLATLLVAFCMLVFFINSQIGYGQDDPSDQGQDEPKPKRKPVTDIDQLHNKLFAAAAKDDVELVKIILDPENGISVNAKDNNDTTVLMYAVRNGSENVVACLLQNQDLSINLQNKDNYSALMFAVRRGDLKIANALKDHGASLAFRYTDFKNQNLVMLAIEGGSIEVLEMVLNYKSDLISEPSGTRMLDWRDNDGEVALTKAVKMNRPDMVRLLYSKNVNLYQDSQNLTDGSTALMIAASNGYDEIISILLEHNVNETLENLSNKRALCLALDHGKWDTARLLLNKTIVPIGTFAKEFLTAVQQNQKELVVLFMKKHFDPMAATAEDGTTPWGIALTNNRKDIASLMLDLDSYTQFKDLGATDVEAAKMAIPIRNGSLNSRFAIATFKRGISVGDITFIGEQIKLNNMPEARLTELCDLIGSGNFDYGTFREVVKRIDLNPDVAFTITKAFSEGKIDFEFYRTLRESGVLWESALDYSTQAKILNQRFNRKAMAFALKNGLPWDRALSDAQNIEKADDTTTGIYCIVVSLPDASAKNDAIKVANLMQSGKWDVESFHKAIGLGIPPLLSMRAALAIMAGTIHKEAWIASIQSKINSPEESWAVAEAVKKEKALSSADNGELVVKCLARKFTRTQAIEFVKLKAKDYIYVDDSLFSTIDKFGLNYDQALQLGRFRHQGFLYSYEALDLPLANKANFEEALDFAKAVYRRVVSLDVYKSAINGSAIDGNEWLNGAGKHTHAEARILAHLAEQNRSTITVYTNAYAAARKVGDTFEQGLEVARLTKQNNLTLDQYIEARRSGKTYEQAKELAYHRKSFWKRLFFQD